MKKLNPNTLIGKVFTYLKTGHSLDIPKSTAMFGIFRLPVAIQGLRKKGIDVRTEIAKPPEGKEFAIYTLPKVIDEDTPVGTRVRVKDCDIQRLNGKVGCITRIEAHEESMPVYVLLDKDTTGTTCFDYKELEPEYLNA